MSYLDPLRLHFAGRFQASVSTVNNDITHYNNATFKPEFQERQTKDSMNGWWNPRGDAAWRFIGCNVTSAWLDTDVPAEPSDAIHASMVADSDLRVTAKLVDLDPEQQLVSAIWGLEVRIVDASGETLLRGQFETASFMDIWDRAASGGGDIGAGSMYQSILCELEWGDLSASPFLQKLKDASPDGLLSIKFNVDGYNMDYKSPEFTRGRVVGTIGPASATEPVHAVRGRQLMTDSAQPPGNFFKPAGGINFCTAVVQEQQRKITIDLGNALPTTVPGGPFTDLGALTIAYESPTSEEQWITIDTIPYLEEGWYERTGGVIDLPVSRTLTDAELAAIQSSRLGLQLEQSGTTKLAIAEAPQGLFLRPDQFVYRFNPGDEHQVSLIATQYGKPLANAAVQLELDPSMLQAPSDPGQPQPGEPASAVQFKESVVMTDHNGIAVATIQASSPGNPRGYIDGQVYGVRASFKDTPAGTPVNQWNFISLLVWDDFMSDEPPVWYGTPAGSLQPIFQQYANLYPVMDRFLNLADYEDVCKNRRLLLLAFGLDPDNPNAMPVTRDMSTAKLTTILRWLNEVGPDGKPLLGKLQGNADANPTGALQSTAASQEETGKPVSAEATKQGGKATAAARRLSVLYPEKYTKA
ncbi:hypothetical protein [Paenibacillus sp. YYML68]|uniref:hypothetical protein n=1 Tax=Paenibacillus sp. YYML68 TaxID=2909250 RepID=UPI0024920E7D|nr:hypothetical protein [Paenibacillus sp. YYML68]